jgi:FkbM family methyltransferase
MKKYVRKIIKGINLIRVPIYREGLKHGVAAAIEHENFLKSISDKGIELVIDAGANIGQFSLAVRENLPQCQIIAFEPLLGPAAKFENVFANDESVVLHQLALNTVEGDVEMHVSNSIDSSSILPITSEQDRIFPNTSEDHLEKVKTAPLSNFISPAVKQRSCLLKIDVQGFELEVLKSAELILDKVKIIFVECSFVELYTGQPLVADIISWLLEKQFILVGVGSMYFDNMGRSIQGDFIFERIADN